MFRLLLLCSLLTCLSCQAPTRSPTSVSSPAVNATASAQKLPTGTWTNLGNNGVVEIGYQSTDNKPQFWMRITFNQPLPTGDRFQLMLQNPDCFHGTYRTSYLIRANSGGQILSAGVPGDATQIVQVDLDSLAGSAFRLACSR